MKLSSHPSFHVCPPSVSNTHHAPSRGAGASPKWPIDGLSLPLLGLASTLLRARNFAELRQREVRRISLPRTSVNSTVRIHRGFITGRYRRGSSAATLQMAFPNDRRVSSWGVKHRQVRYKLGLSYIFIAISTHLLLKGFTFMSMCGMNQELISVRIFLSFPTITRYGHWL